MYSAYVLTDASRNYLLEMLHTNYSKVYGHHITVEFGITKDSEIPDDAFIEVVGHVGSGDGLEALLVEIDGKRKRPDGKTYHLTWSLDPEKYAPKDSNDLIANFHPDGFIREFARHIPINATPKHLK